MSGRLRRALATALAAILAAGAVATAPIPEQSAKPNAGTTNSSSVYNREIQTARREKEIASLAAIVAAARAARAEAEKAAAAKAQAERIALEKKVAHDRAVAEAAAKAKAAEQSRLAALAAQARARAAAIAKARAEAAARARAAAAAEAAARARAAAIAAAHRYVRPLYGGYYVSSWYGWRSSGMHYGVDLAAPTGTPVHAMTSGTIVFAGWDNTGFGNSIVIQNWDGTFTRYGHMSRYSGYVGKHVAPGDYVGNVGSTGNSTGSHLHVQMYTRSPYMNFNAINLVAYLSARGLNF